MNKYKLVPNEEKFFEFIRILRTHEDNIHGFVKTKPISKEEQYTYMEKYLKNYFVCVLNDEPVGFVGVIDDDIRVATAPEFKNKGVAKFMINEIIKLFPNAFAKIKVDNELSVKLFESCGFKKKFYIYER